MTDRRAFVDAVLERLADALEGGSGLDTLEQDLQKVANDFVGATAPASALAKAIEPEQRIAWGWASVSTVGGEPYFDLQDDYIPVGEVQKAAHEAIRHRVSKAMHEGRQVGEIVESIVFTKALQDALGIDLGQEGWFTGVHFTDDRTWAKVTSGEYQGFSLGGSGVRKEYVVKFVGDEHDGHAATACEHGSPACAACKAKGKKPMRKGVALFNDVIKSQLT